MRILKYTGGLALVAVMLLLAACNNNQEAAPEATPEISAEATATVEPTQTPAPPEAEPTESAQPAAEAPDEGTPPTAKEAAATVMRALQNKDMDQLAAWVHKDKGLRFSPYAYVDPKNDLVFTSEQIEGSMKDSTLYKWRSFPGNGEVIELTFADYFKQFIYDADFIKEGEIALNKGLGEGTTLNNLNEVYPKESYDFVEYHIDGIDPKVEGMDWRSLRLVFEKIGEDHALVGIIHDQWTP
ncbi:hypothetical protein J7E73_03900 [Paenibacillus albidus]|uniref:hypothetical protein n=1 Tax=Paenibacillus albidus TaxID=2041023 RepID=UPI001BE8A14E|nr:hypothetical protein [Paenibacillus albidus]MBT2288291.1 hypothetical protein [Paenibacillus albidus]